MKRSSFAAIICHKVIEFVACLTGTSAAGSQTALRKMPNIDSIPQFWDLSPKSNGPLFLFYSNLSAGEQVFQSKVKSSNIANVNLTR